VKYVDLKESDIIATRFSGVFISPWGNFSSASKMAKSCPVDIGYTFCLNACKRNSVVVNKRSAQLNPFLTDDDIGRTLKDVGFNFIEYESGKNNKVVAELLGKTYEANDDVVRTMNNKILIERFKTTTSKIVITPFGINTKRSFNDVGLDILVRCIDHDVYNNVSMYFGVSNWKQCVYKVVDVCVDDEFIDIEVSGFGTFITLYRILKERNVRITTFKGVFITPDGAYASIPEVVARSIYAKNSQKIWKRLDVVITSNCAGQSSILTKHDVGKTYRDKGFDFIKYDPGVNETVMIDALTSQFSQ